MVLIVGCNEVRHPDQNCNCRDRSMTFHQPFHRPSTTFHRACYPLPPYTPLPVEGSHPSGGRSVEASHLVPAGAKGHAFALISGTLLGSRGEQGEPPLGSGIRLRMKWCIDEQSND